MRTLIYSILILTAAASFSYAQSGGETEAGLLARAETRTASVTYNIRSGEALKEESARSTPASAMNAEDTADISLAVKNELETQKNSGLSYESPSLKAEDIPLVMSSTDKKTISVVMPPFLYFKTQF